MRVAGVGNILLSDEGIGVHLVAALSRENALPGVEYVDGGVMGSALPDAIEGEDRVVILDTAAAPFPPGTVIRLSPDDLEGGGRDRVSLHDLDLSHAIGLLRLRDTLPEMVILGKVRTEIERFAREGGGRGG